MATGWTIKCSLVGQDDTYKMKFNYKDSDGINVNQEAAGNDPESVVYQLANDAIADIIKQQKVLEEKVPEEPEKKVEEPKKKVEEKEDNYTAQLEKIIEDLTYENNSLKTDLNILQRRADDAVNREAQKTNKKNDKVEDWFEDWFGDFDYIPCRYFRFKRF